jgi:hypothetical protein
MSLASRYPIFIFFGHQLSTELITGLPYLPVVEDGPSKKDIASRGNLRWPLMTTLNSNGGDGSAFVLPARTLPT